MCHIFFICIDESINFFFFFQAEDGIRDRNVTGVQTCALPISSAARVSQQGGPGSLLTAVGWQLTCGQSMTSKLRWPIIQRMPSSDSLLRGSLRGRLAPPPLTRVLR